MNEVCAIPAAKKQKIVGAIEVDKDKDRISELPDSLLHYILSFLPTKNAAGTCILSTRWKDLWFSSPISLDLKCSGSSRKGMKWKYNNFTRFVDKVLCRHASNLKIINLSFDEDLDDSFVDSWISAVVRRQVQELDLSIRVGHVLTLSHCLCTCKTVTSLRLDCCCRLELPRGVFFPSLKTLHLSSMTFSDDVSFHELFTALPVLENLQLCCYWTIKEAIISIPTLKSLTLDIGTRDRIKREFKISIFAKNLVYLSCTSDLTVDLLLDSFPLLADACIEFESFWMHSDSSVLAAKLLNGVRFAKSIKLGNRSLKSLHELIEERPTGEILPILSTLTVLEVTSIVTRNTSETLQKIFQNSPMLELLTIKKVEGGKWPKNPSLTILPFLNTFSLQTFNGLSHQMTFLKFMLKICTLLEKLQLCCTKLLTSQPKRQEFLMYELEMIPRASEKCVIELLMFNL